MTRQGLKRPRSIRKVNSPATEHSESQKQTQPRPPTIPIERTRWQWERLAEVEKSGRGRINLRQGAEQNWTVAPSPSLWWGMWGTKRDNFTTWEIPIEQTVLREAIKRISNSVGTNFDDGSSIRYIILKLKNLCWIFQPTMMRALHFHQDPDRDLGKVSRYPRQE